MLELTYKELEDILMGNFMPERFELLYDEIPAPSVGQKDYKISDYMEDDGRRFNLCIFKDNESNTEYNFSYVFHPEHTTELRWCMLGDIKNVKIVDKSSLVQEKVTEDEKIPEESDEDKRCRIQEEKYNATDKDMFDPMTSNVPLRVIHLLSSFIKNGNFTKRDLLDKLTPVCIEYKIERNSLWNYVKK